MPGYEPFLLCDFHVHSTWSDGKLSVAEVVDLYGATGKFDVIAITDHILMKKDLLARAGRIATLGQPRFGLREDDFDAYLADVLSVGPPRGALRPGGRVGSGQSRRSLSRDEHEALSVRRQQRLPQAKASL